MSEDGGRRRSNKLGRGLSALLGEDDEDQAQLERLRQSRTLPVDQLSPGPFQPRRRFDNEELEELAESVREQGVIQPILVRRDPEDDSYQIIAGERRWRAAQLAQLHEIPVLIREFDDRTAMEIALVENVQRRDLTPLEEAEGYRRLTDEYEHSQDEIARAVGKSRSHVANTMRLLNLPDDVRTLLDDGQLTAGHARALLGVENAAALAREVVTRKLNVRDTERLVQRSKAGALDAGARSGGAPAKDADTRILEEDLSERTGLAVAVNHNARTGAGSVVLRYRDLDQLDLIVERLSATKIRSEPAPGSLPGPVLDPWEDMDAEVDQDGMDTSSDDVAEEDGAALADGPDPDEVAAGTDEMPDEMPDMAAEELSEDSAEDSAEDVAEDVADTIDPSEIRWDFDDDGDDDDPLVPKGG